MAANYRHFPSLRIVQTCYYTPLMRMAMSRVVEGWGWGRPAAWGWGECAASGPPAVSCRSCQSASPSRSCSDAGRGGQPRRQRTRRTRATTERSSPPTTLLCLRCLTRTGWPVKKQLFLPIMNILDRLNQSTHLWRWPTYGIRRSFGHLLIIELFVIDFNLEQIALVVSAATHAQLL